MDSKTLLKIMLASGILATVGGFGCALVKGSGDGSSSDAVSGNGDVSQILKSTLQLQGGCSAAKVGPRQLLVAARCVSGNPIFAVGKTISFTTAANKKVATTGSDAGTLDSGTTTPTDAGTTPADDAGGYDDYCWENPWDCDYGDAGNPTYDAGTTPPVDSGVTAPSTSTTGNDPTARSVTIADVKINPNYVSKCTDDSICGFTKAAASDAPDIAVIVLDADLDSVPTVPIDLDPVAAGDPLLAVTANCASIDVQTTAAPQAVTTEAVPAKSVNFDGSPFASSPQLVTSLGGSYVVTPGAGWKKAGPRLCKTDIGAPLFRAGTAAVAGVTSNYTTYVGGHLPVTTEHTRVDSDSRFKIGAWLTTLGATTTHSCSTSTAGCTASAVNAGTPPGLGVTDGGADGGARDASAKDASSTDSGTTTSTPPSTPPDAPHSDTLPGDPSNNSSDTASSTSSGDDGEDAAVPSKKSAAKGGCSAAPSGSGSAPSGGLVFGVAIALGALVARRRRAS